MSQDRINFLAAEITKHRDLYYNDQAIVPDEVFDAWVDELQRLDPENKVVLNVGAPVRDTEWEKSKHEYPMGSLNKATDPEEITTWISDTVKPSNSIFYSEKLDGLSILITYENGNFVRAVSRGSGLEGDDISSNVLRMHGVVKKLPAPLTGALRGEIVLRKSNFEKYFAKDYSNVRNAASGISRRYDGEGCQYLDVFVYQVFGNDDLESEFYQLQYIQNILKLQAPNYEAYSGSDKLEFVLRTMEKYEDGLRDNIDYEIDGLVLSINDLSIQQELGIKHNRPVGAVAVKFKSEQAQSTIKNIFVQVGNSGKLTPVVEIDPPVSLAGAMVARASIYNFSYIKEMKIDVGAEIIICRSGDVIPVVLGVVKSTGTIFSTPTQCPVCAGPVEMRGENLMCLGADTCPAQVAGAIKNWINALNVLDFGEKLIERLVETGKVSKIIDLYKLSVSDLASLERMGDKSAIKCRTNLWNKNPIPLETLLGSLSIPMVAASTIKMLMEAGYDTLDKIMGMSLNQIEGVKGLGPVKSKFLFDGLKRNQVMINELLEIGVKVEVKEIKEGKLSGMKFVFTGAMEHPRKELEQMVGDNGGEVSKSVSKNTTYLVVADFSTKKAEAALKNGTKLLTEYDFLAMVK